MASWGQPWMASPCKRPKGGCPARAGAGLPSAHPLELALQSDRDLGPAAGLADDLHPDLRHGEAAPPQVALEDLPLLPFRDAGRRVNWPVHLRPPHLVVLVWVNVQVKLSRPCGNRVDGQQLRGSKVRMGRRREPRSRPLEKPPGGPGPPAAKPVRSQPYWGRSTHGRSAMTQTSTDVAAAGPLSDHDLALIDAYWRAANYLSVGQIYLLDNPLLRQPLRPENVKPRLLGHWGTTPGLNFIYAHMN